MSKKILKRSLALGALMAFVITGSAWAAVPNYNDWATENTYQDAESGVDISHFEDTKYKGQYYSNPEYPNNNDKNSLIEITVIHTDEFTSWNNFKDTYPDLEKRYYPNSEKLEEDVTLNSAVGFVGYNDSLSNASYNNTDLNGHKLTINHSGDGYALESSGQSDNFTNVYYETYIHPDKQGPTCQYVHIYTGLENKQLDLPGFNIYDNAAGGALEINSSNVAIYGYGKINVDELKITADNNAIQSDLEGATGTHKMEIYANGIEINAGTKANAIQVYNTLDIGSDGERVVKLDIQGKDGGTYARAIRVSGATANIYADTLNISGATEATKVSSGTLKLVVNEAGSITNEFYADKDGTVDATFGAGVNWTGKFVTAGNATKSTLDLSGTWTLKEVFPNDDDTPGEANSLTEATFRKGSTFVIDGATYEASKGVYALNGVGDKATLTVENGAKLTVEGIDYNTYNVAKGFSNITDAKDKWDVTSLNTLMQGEWTADATNGLQLKVVAKEAEKIAEDLGVSEATGDFLNSIVEDAKESGVDTSDGTAGGKLVGLANAASKSNNDVVKAKAAAQAVEAVQKMAEAGGNSATAANVVTNVTNVTGQRLSFSGGNAGGNKGGHGVGLLEEGSGAAIWAQYVHGKDSVENMPSEAGASSYEGQYNGIVMGVDFKKVGKFQSGIAFNYGEGDTNSVNTTSPTRSEYDFWGIGYYGNIRNADSNVIFDIGYAKTDSDVTSNVIAEGYAETFEASPETTTWTAGVKVEKLYQNNNVQVVPYTGLRYMSIDADDYTTKCGATSYNMQRQDIWLLPVGVSIKQEIVNPNGWVVTPKVDLSYIWAFGDTDSEMEIATAFDSKTNIGYDVMDDGSWMGLVGVEAAKDDWTFGVSYSYQKGDHSESKKWYVDAKYSF